ncbi:hypothetical protein TNCV_309471 [Trichonephila clavipes]|nr:hypothetical protein TNCV_309471 [Trichonephila clavipes]
MLPTACWKLYGHSRPYGADVDRRPLTSPSVIHCPFFELFGARWSTDFTFRRPLPVFRVVRCSLVHCFQTHITVEQFRSTRAPIAR